METRFANRTAAGRALAELLEPYAGRGDVTVLALPRGGVPVGLEIARRLGAPLDVLIVRKLGVPWQPELAVGAIAGGGFRAMNADVIAGTRLSEAELNDVLLRETQELERRERLYRGGHPSAALEGWVVILVDDGIATGATMRVAMKAARHARPASLVVATPVIAQSTLAELRAGGDEVVALLHPGNLSSIGEWYEDFTQLTDSEVSEALNSL